MSTEPSLLEVARSAVEVARGKGAQEVAAEAYRTREIELGWRDGKKEKISDATSRSVSLNLYVDGRYSAVRTSDLRPDAFGRFVEEAVAMARVLARDPHRGLPDRKLSTGLASIDLKLMDPNYAEITTAARLALAQELEDSARAADARRSHVIVSVATRVTDLATSRARVTSNGFEGEQHASEFWLDSEVTVKDADGRRPSGNDWVGARMFRELPPAERVGRSSATRALDQLGAKPMPSVVAPMVVEARAAGRLVRALNAALTAESLQQKRSFLDGKRGAEVASSLMTMIDDPHLVGGFGSRFFDGEGLVAKRFPILERGTLRAFYIDDYYGRKLKIPPTTAAPSNLVFERGAKGPAELVAEVGDAVLVTGFLGGNSNSTTGDFSLGIEGYRIRKGQRAEPLAGMNVAGNHLAFWKKLVAVGNDPYAYGNIRTPTLVFDAVQIAGT